MQVIFSNEDISNEKKKKKNDNIKWLVKYS